ncbi:ANR family transcriptional regulator [Salmonella enterica subsp. enterica serovar Montevideo]|nr:ANR family transcriptional regulator [Salmonella enterica subsp. enterica serovar Montevideo]
MKPSFLDIASEAARKERQMEYKEAGTLWNKALFLARHDSNADYCYHRANFCLGSQFTRKKGG